MLKTTPEAIYQEIQAAERYRARLCKHKKDMVRAYTGPYYGGSQQPEFDDPENFHYEYSSYLLPRLVFNNPRVNMRSRRLGPQRLVARALEHGMNRWCVDTDFRKTLIPPAQDYLFLHGVLLTTQEAVDTDLHTPEESQMGNKVPYLPKVTHIDTDDFLWDPVGRTPQDWRWAGHRFVRDKEDLIAEAEEKDEGWNLEAVKALAAELDQRQQERRDQNGDVPDRDEVELFEVWYPEHWPEEWKGKTYKTAKDAAEDGFHGMIYTMSRDQMKSQSDLLTGDFIREPRPFYGPRWGMYTYIGCYPVPGEAARLSPLMAVEGQIRTVNAHARAVRDGAASHKKLAVVAGDDPKLAQAIKDAKHNHVVGVKGFTKEQVVGLEVGGVTAQQIEALAMFKDQLDRNAGLGEAQRGATTSGATATETAVAANSSALRMDFIIQQWNDGVTRALRSVAWYLYHDDRVDLPLGEEATEDKDLLAWAAERRYDISGGMVWSGGPDGLFFEGGDEAPDSGAAFDDLELEIEPYSMERTDQGLMQRRVTELLGILPQLVEIIAMAPQGVDWAELLGRVGDAFNMPGLGQMIHPDEIAAQVGAQAKAAGGEGPMLGKFAGGEAGRPRGPQATETRQSPAASVGAGGSMAGAAAATGGI